MRENTKTKNEKKSRNILHTAPLSLEKRLLENIFVFFSAL
jgi:hypothetical protein